MGWGEPKTVWSKASRKEQQLVVTEVTKMEEDRLLVKSFRQC